MPLPPGLVVKRARTGCRGSRPRRRCPRSRTPGPPCRASRAVPRAGPFGRRLDGIPHQVDQRLLELIRVAAGDQAVGARETCTRPGGCTAADLAEQRRDIAIGDRRFRQAREFAVARQESPQRLRAIGDERQVVGQLLALRFVRRARRQRIAAGLDHGLDRRERIIELVPDHADQPPPARRVPRRAMPG